MRVLIVARGYPTNKYKMNGIFEFDQAKALVEEGVEVIYAAIDVRSIRRWRKWGIEKRTIEGIKVYALNLPVGRVPKFILQKIRTYGLQCLYKMILREQGKPDVMHAHFSSIGFTASVLKEKYNVPFVLTEHLSALMKPTINKEVFAIANQAYINADSLITVSPELKDILLKKFNREAIYIPNIVDTNLFFYTPRSSDEVFRFISIGGLICRKRMDLTIEAFARAFPSAKKVTLTIFGEGPERVNLESIIQKYKIDDRVKLMGLQYRRDISKLLKISDCFVLSSQAETFGVVYIEALASGVPVIATKCGGPESFVNDRNGIFVPIDDFDALVDAMRNIYDNINKYDRALISKEARSLFSPASIANSLIDVYKDVIN